MLYELLKPNSNRKNAVRHSPETWTKKRLGMCTINFSPDVSYHEANKLYINIFLRLFGI